MDPNEESFLTRSISEVESVADEESYHHRGQESFNFPPGVDLGTSYGSYLLSRGKSTKKTTHTDTTVNGHGRPTNITKLPAIIPTIRQDISLLLYSLNELYSRLRANGHHSTALETSLTDLHNLSLALSMTPPTVTLNKQQIIFRYLQQLTQAIVSLTPEIGKGSSSPSTSDDRRREMKAFRRLYQTTEAELVATRNYCQKLQNKLETMFEQAELKQSQLSCELIATKKLLAEANFELQKERTKSQSAYLQSTQSQRELGKYKKVLVGTNYHKQMLENEQLRAQLEEKTRIEEQLRKRWHEDHLKLTQIMNKETAARKHHIVPSIAGRGRGGKVLLQRTNAARKIYQQECLRRKPLQQPINIHHGSTKQTKPDHIQQRHKVVPLVSKWDELVNLARFSDERVAMETKEILSKQGLL